MPTAASIGPRCFAPAVRRCADLRNFATRVCHDAVGSENTGKDTIRAHRRAHELLIDVVELLRRVVGIVAVLVNVLGYVLHTSVKTGRAPPLETDCADQSAAIVLNLEEEGVIAKGAVWPRGIFTDARYTATLFTQATFERRKEIQLVPVTAIGQFANQRRLYQILTQIVVERSVIVLEN